MKNYDLMLQDKYSELGKVHVEAMNKIAMLEADNAKLKACVEFYADEKNWMGFRRSMRIEIINDHSNPPHITRDVWQVGGKLARQTLEEIENGN